MTEEIISVLNTIKSFRPIRNKFAHFCWSRENDETIFGSKLNGKIPQVKNNKTDKDESVRITNKQLELTYKKAYEAVDKLQIIIESLPELKEDSNLFNKLI
jgi:hypothetical protein